MSRVLPLAAFAITALLGGHVAQAQNLATEAKACRQLTDPARRLACYDALQLQAEPATAAPVATAAPLVPAAAAADPVAKFGQESVKAPAGAPPELKQIESRIRGKFHGWHAGSQLELENGQVWRIADGSEAVYELQDPKVVVHRGMLGAFYLEIEGVGFQMRVTRMR
ncbi:hypothetical protein [Roseateles saccharophilus]|uniref:Uncharacterized protein n=1 Tax=Roseateles saccharophilus TaxID=304 RepID=A0A4V2VT02_ROSSA|nr:hypothetical protein [Roseateles saccharophilus]MDG0831229.1 hypothetical protein [Roseateles saccharophilus]TCV04350.1 hypothetical protein EV671_1001105 [Roseateles saccharophilus]